MKILFVTRRSINCGVADYGKRLYSILKTAIDITLLEVDSADQINYTGYDIALYNYHHATLPFISCENKNIKHVALFHEAFQNIQPDQWINVSELPRPVPIRQIYHTGNYSNPIPFIGSFGFGFPDKNYTGIARMIKREFERAVFRLHIASAQFGDEDGTQALERFREVEQELKGSQIELNPYFHYMEPNDLLAWLATNDINIFNCIPTHGRGISSSIDYALSARRPIAISNSEMYRHLPREICVDNISLPRLIAKGIEPLKQVYEDNSNERLIEKMKKCLA